jgi:hypothetical protein
MANQCLRSAIPTSPAGGKHQTRDAQLGTPLSLANFV